MYTEKNKSLKLCKNILINLFIYKFIYLKKTPHLCNA